MEKSNLKVYFAVWAKYVFTKENVIYFITPDNRNYTATAGMLVETPQVKWWLEADEDNYQDNKGRDEEDVWGDDDDVFLSDEDLASLEKFPNVVKNLSLDFAYPADKIICAPKSYIGAKVRENFVARMYFNLDSTIIVPLCRYCQGGYTYDNKGRLRLREYLWMEGPRDKAKFYHYGTDNGYTFLHELSYDEWQKRSAKWQKIAKATHGKSVKEGTLYNYLEDILVLPNTIQVSPSSRFYYLREN